MGGLHSRELLALLRGLNGINIVGADVVGVSPRRIPQTSPLSRPQPMVFDLLGRW